MKLKRGVEVFAVTILVAFCCFVLSITLAEPKEVNDIPESWSKSAVESGVENNILEVKDSLVRPTDALTRAEMAYGINSAFGATKKADISGFLDVNSITPYYEEMQKAVAMGTFSGYEDHTLRPNNNITREEMFAVIYNALQMESGNAEVLNKFSDKALIGNWAVPFAASLVQNGYVAGDAEGTLSPKNNISREEFAQILKNIIDNYYSVAGEYTNIPAGSVIINTPGVTLKDSTITGELIIADGVGTGDVTLDNVTVEGRTIVRGGGENSIKVLNGSKLRGKVLVNNRAGKVRIHNEKSDIINVEISTEVILDGDFGKVTVKKAVNIETTGKIDELHITEKSEINAKSGSDIVKVNVFVNAEGTVIKGSGKVDEVDAKANNVSIKTEGTKVTVSVGVTGVTAGGTKVTAGSTVTIEKEKESSGDGSSSGGGGGGSSGGSSKVTIPTLVLTDIATGGKIDLGKNYDKFEVSYEFSNGTTMWYTPSNRYLTETTGSGSIGWFSDTKIVNVKYKNDTERLRIRPDYTNFEIDKLNGKVIVEDFNVFKGMYEYKVSRLGEGTYSNFTDESQLIIPDNKVPDTYLFIRIKAQSNLLPSQEFKINKYLGIVEEVSDVLHDYNNKPYRSIEFDSYYNLQSGRVPNIAYKNSSDKYLSKIGDGKTLEDFGIEEGNLVSYYSGDGISLQESENSYSGACWICDFVVEKELELPEFKLNRGEYGLDDEILLGGKWNKYQVAYSDNTADFDEESLWKNLSASYTDWYSGASPVFTVDDDGIGYLHTSCAYNTGRISIEPTYFAIRLKNDTDEKQIIQVREIASIEEVKNGEYHTAIRIGTDYTNYMFDVELDVYDGTHMLSYYNNTFISSTLSLPSNGEIRIWKKGEEGRLDSKVYNVNYNYEKKDIEIPNFTLNTQFGVIDLGNNFDNYKCQAISGTSLESSWKSPTEQGYFVIYNTEYSCNQSLIGIVLLDNEGQPTNTVQIIEPLCQNNIPGNTIEVNYEDCEVILPENTYMNYEYCIVENYNEQNWYTFLSNEEYFSEGELVQIRIKGNNIKLAGCPKRIDFLPEFELDVRNKKIDLGRNWQDYQVTYFDNEGYNTFDYYDVTSRYLTEGNVAGGGHWTSGVSLIRIVHKEGLAEEAISVRNIIGFEIDKTTGKLGIDESEWDKYEYKRSEEDEYNDITTENCLRVDGGSSAQELWIRKKVSDTYLESAPFIVERIAGIVTEIRNPATINNHGDLIHRQIKVKTYGQSIETKTLYIFAEEEDDVYTVAGGTGTTFESENFGIEVGDAVTLYKYLNKHNNGKDTDNWVWIDDVRLNAEDVPTFEISEGSIDFGSDYAKYKYEAFNGAGHWYDASSIYGKTLPQAVFDVNSLGEERTTMFIFAEDALVDTKELRTRNDRPDFTADYENRKVTVTVANGKTASDYEYKEYGTDDDWTTLSNNSQIIAPDSAYRIWIRLKEGTVADGVSGYPTGMIFDRKATDTERTALNDLHECSIMLSSETQYDERVDAKITYIEMAEMLCKMTGLTETVAGNADITYNFKDAEEIENGWMNLAISSGIITGFEEDGEFVEVSEEVNIYQDATFNEALTYIVNALGRGEYVSASGDWPSNYANSAESLGITTGVSGNDTKLGNIAIMIHNALDKATYVVDTIDSEGNKTFKNGDTLRELHFSE